MKARTATSGSAHTMKAESVKKALQLRWIPIGMERF